MVHAFALLDKEDLELLLIGIIIDPVSQVFVNRVMSIADIDWLVFTHLINFFLQLFIPILLHFQFFHKLHYLFLAINQILIKLLFNLLPGISPIRRFLKLFMQDSDFLVFVFYCLFPLLNLKVATDDFGFLQL